MGSTVSRKTVFKRRLTPLVFFFFFNMKRKTQTAVTNMKLNKSTAGIEFHSEHPVFSALVRDGPLEKLWGGGGGRAK